MAPIHHDTVRWGATARRPEQPRPPIERVEPPRTQEELEHLRKRHAELTAIAARLIEECWRLHTDNEDLRASAEIWIRMYEQQLDRANALEQQLYGGPRRV